MSDLYLIECFKRRWKQLLGTAVDFMAVGAFAFLAFEMAILADVIAQSTRSHAVWVPWDPNWFEVYATGIIAGATALAVGLLCLKFKASKVLATSLASVFCLLVTSDEIILYLKETANGDHQNLSARPITLLRGLVFIFVATPVIWHLMKARKDSDGSRHSAFALLSATFVSVGFISLPSWVWFAGLRWSSEIPTTKQVQRPGITAESDLSLDERVRRIIARQLRIPEERVIPSARFDEDLGAHANEILEILDTLENVFAINIPYRELRPINTVQDAIDFVASPESFASPEISRGTHQQKQDKDQIAELIFTARHPNDRLYSKQAWAKVDGQQATVGLTYNGQMAFGASGISYVGELPKVGDEIKACQSIANIESLYVSGDLWAPVSGVVIDVNPELTKNIDHLYRTWFVKVILTDSQEVRSLCSSHDLFTGARPSCGPC